MNLRKVIVGLLVIASGCPSVMGMFAVAEDTIPEKTVVSRESWTGSYTVDEKQYDNMTYVAFVYSDNSVEIKGQHTYNWSSHDGWSKTFDLGVFWYDDSLYSDSMSFITQSDYLTTITNYDETRIGYAFSLYNGLNEISDGVLFDFTITPKEPFTAETTIDVFGHKIKINSGGEPSFVSYAEYKALQNELENYQSENSIGNVDADGNGEIDASDAALILQFAAYHGAGGELGWKDWISEMID